MKRKSLLLSLIIIFLSLTMSFIDGFYNPSYIIKSLIKILLFLVIPIIYLSTQKELHLIKDIFHINKKHIGYSMLFGLCIYIVIVVGYIILKQFIDFSAITGILNENGINIHNFIYISIYISFMNSLLEEFFFRGCSFMILKEHTSKRYAYMLSGMMFSLYHAGMTSGWFHIGIYVLCLLALFIAGCFFNYINDQYKHIYPSWIIHMFANFGINTVGFMLFLGG